MLDIKEVGSILGVCEDTVKEWVKEGRIQCKYDNDKIVFTEDDVNDFIEKTKIKLITPQSQMEQLGKMIKDNNCFDIDKYCKDNDVLSVEEIEKLINSI